MGVLVVSAATGGLPSPDACFAVAGTSIDIAKGGVIAPSLDTARSRLGVSATGGITSASETRRLGRGDMMSGRPLLVLEQLAVLARLEARARSFSRSTGSLIRRTTCRRR